MDTLMEALESIRTRIEEQGDLLNTEEATKTALILPFINALGYNVFDPREVVPEFTADALMNKGEKVDYAIVRDGNPILLFECKSVGTNLDSVNYAQLHRYFAETESRFGVLTDGVVYRFYSDLDAINKMDERPFLEFNLLEFDQNLSHDLEKFTKQSFDISVNLLAAGELKYTREIKRIMAGQLREPSGEFVKFFVSQIHSGRITTQVMNRFSGLLKSGLNEFINDRINDRLKSALAGDGEPTPKSENPSEDPKEDSYVDNGVVTTVEEIEGTYIIKAIVREIVDVKRIEMRDLKSYCSILLDHNNRKPICRLYFNGPQKHLGLFNPDREEVREPIDSIDDIYRFSEQLKSIVGSYDSATDNGASS